MPTDDEALLAGLAPWLEHRLPGTGPVTVDDVRRPASGFSAETVMFTARDQRLVLRVETPDPPVYPTQVPGVETEVDIQYRVMDAITSSSDVPIAPLIGYESDPGVLGAPFFVMGFVEGVVPIETPPYTTTGFFVESTDAERKQLVERGVDVLARIHAIDWQAAGLDWLVPAGASPTTARQLQVWEDYGYRELDGRVNPSFDRAVAWLHDNLPPERSPVLCWGDPRPGNVIWRDFSPVCVTDFEAACISPAGHDLGWWLMFDRWMHETIDAPRQPGEPTREEQRDRYAESSGTDPGDTTFDEVFAAMRYTAIVVRVMNRTVARGLMPADHTIWLENPAVVCLDQLMAPL